MFHMTARRRSQCAASVGTDTVLWGLSLPRGSVVHDIKGVVSLVGSSNLPRPQITAYGVEIHIVPIPDPDLSAAYDSLWDNLIPKDTDVQLIDLDTATADLTPFFEPGEVDWTQVLDIGKRPVKLWGGYRFQTIHDALATFRDDTNAAVEWLAGGRERIRVRKSYRVTQPSVLMCGIASPSLDDTDATPPRMILENEWSRVKYASQMLEQAMISLIGLEESGAETPWEDQVDLLQEHLEPDLFEQTSGLYTSQTWTAVGDMKISHSVTGRLDLKSLSTGR